MTAWLSRWTIRTGPPDGASAWIWPFTAIICVAVILAALTGQGAVYHGDIRGYSNPLGGPDWSMLWQAIVPQAAFYTGPDGSPLGTAFDLELRPWPVVLLYEITGGGALTTAAQVILFGIAAISLIAVTCRLPIRPGARYAAASGLTILLASSPVLLFQLLQASEALSSSLCIIAFAAALTVYSRRGTSDAGVWGILLVSASLASIVRPQLMLIWIPVTAYLVIRSHGSDPPDQLPAALPIKAFVALRLVAVGWGSAIWRRRRRH